MKIVQTLDDADQIGATLAAWDRLADQWCLHPLFVQMARAIVPATTHNAQAETAAVWAWVRKNIKYRRDPVGHEWLQDPVQTLLQRAGDCDDVSLMAGTLLQAIGHRCASRAVTWVGSTQPTHCIGWDLLSGQAIDPCAPVPPSMWDITRAANIRGLR